MKQANIDSIRNMFRDRTMSVLYAEDRKSAVVVPLVNTEEGLSVLFEVRARDIVQGGEVCFPGGAVEEGEDSVQTALRETAEELLVDKSGMEIIAPLFSVNGPGGMEVKSYLGYIENYGGTFSEGEVDHVFTVPVEWFMNNGPLVYDTKMEVVLDDDYPYDLIPGGRNYPFRANPRTFYFYRVKGEVIWGLTGTVLYNFIEVLKKRFR